MTTKPEDALVERLRSQAQSASKAHKMLADAKTARQTDGGGPYGYVAPEQTLEWQAADAITTLLERERRLSEALTNLVEAGEQRRVKDFDPTSRVTVLETRTKDIVAFHEALDEARAALTEPNPDREVSRDEGIDNAHD